MPEMFQLTNAKQESVGINNDVLRSYTPTGLGVQFTNTYSQLESYFKNTDTKVAQGQLQVNVLFGDIESDSYQTFADFAEFLAYQPLTLTYTTDSGTWYRDAKVNSLTKTEIGGSTIFATDRLNEIFTLDFINPWYQLNTLTSTKYELDSNYGIYGKIYGQAAQAGGRNFALKTYLPSTNDGTNTSTESFDLYDLSTDFVNLGAECVISFEIIGQNDSGTFDVSLSSTSTDVVSQAIMSAQTLSKSKTKVAYNFNLTDRNYKHVTMTLHNVTGQVIVSRLKIEMNDTATPWVIAPEDNFIKRVKSGNVSAWINSKLSNIVSAIQTLNLNTITLNVKLTAVDKNDSKPVVSDDDLAELEAAIKAIQGFRDGTRIILEPYPYVNQGVTPETEWVPDDMNTWFTYWGNAVNQVAELGEKYHVYAMYVASNLVNMESYTSKWATLITNTKAIYSGQIAYRTNYWVTATWDSGTQAAYQKKLNSGIWQYVDIIAIAAYFELTDKQNPTLSDLEAAIFNVPKYNRGQNVFNEIKAFYDKWKKPILFGELGVPDFSSAASIPWNYVMPEGDTHSSTIQEYWFNCWTDVFGDQPWFLGYSIFSVGDPSIGYYVETGGAASYLNHVDLGQTAVSNFPEYKFMNDNLAQGTGTPMVLIGDNSDINATTFLYQLDKKVMGNTVTVSFDAILSDDMSASSALALQLYGYPSWDAVSGYIGGLTKGANHIVAQYTFPADTNTGQAVSLRGSVNHYLGTISIENVKVELGGTATPWQANANDQLLFSHLEPYVYLPQNTNSLGFTVQNDSVYYGTQKGSPVLITIYGPLSQPSWDVIQNGEVFASDRYFINLNANQRLVVSSMPDDEYARIYENDGSYQSAIPYQDKNRTNFVTLPVGNSSIRLSLPSSVTAKLQWKLERLLV